VVLSCERGTEIPGSVRRRAGCREFSVTPVNHRAVIIVIIIILLCRGIQMPIARLPLRQNFVC